MLRLEALDTLFFRDGKPFNKDGDNWVDGLFPPAPSVFYGALRSAFFANNISLFSKANQDDDPTKNLKIKGVFLQIGESNYFPLPLDLVKSKNKNEEALPLVLQNTSFVSTCPTEMILMPPSVEEVENVENGLLDDISFDKYLNADVTDLQFLKLSDYITPEPRIGISINHKTKTAQEGQLYRVGIIRPESLTVTGKERRKVKILLDYEGLSLPSKGLMRIGGEGKAIFYEHVDGFEIKPPEVHGRRFKLYFATPAKFNKGWLPDWLDEKTLTGGYKGISLKLLTAVIGRYLPIGGFDIKKKQPKPMLRAVPAGSVYYFEVLDGTNLAEVVDKFHYTTISDIDGEQGFGLALVGGVA